MNNRFFFKCIFTIGFLFFVSTDLHAQDCNFTIDVATTVSICEASGTATAELKGEDIAFLDEENAQYRIQEIGGKGFATGFAVGGVFKDLYPGRYQITVRVFCSKSGLNVVKQSSEFTITGTYKPPNMYVVTEKVRKTLNCATTGMIPCSFNNGVGPYTVTLTSYPIEHQGKDTVFTRVTAGEIEVNNLAAGNYTLTLADACGNKMENIQIIVGKVTSDYPKPSEIGVGSTYKDGTNCTGLYINGTTTIVSTHELYYYWTNQSLYYDAFIQEDNNNTNLILANYKNSHIYFNLNTLTFADLYPISATLQGGGHKISLKYKAKNCNTYSDPIPIPVRRPYCNGSAMKFTCDGMIVSVRQWTDYDGVICYPYTAEIFDVKTGNVIASKSDIPSWNQTEIGLVPYGVEYKILCTGADGGQWTVASLQTATYNNNMYSYKGKYSVNNYCQENKHTGNISIYRSNSLLNNGVLNNGFFEPGTKIRSLSVPVGMNHSPDTILNVNNITYFYPYGASNIIYAGEYKFEVTDPCFNTRDTLTVVFPEINATYLAQVGNYSQCINNIGKTLNYIQYSGIHIPGESTITYKGGGDPNSVVHKFTKIPSNIGRVFNPFSLAYTNIIDFSPGIVAGAYQFEIYDAFCNQTKMVILNVAQTYSAHDLNYTVSYNCHGMYIKPTGQLKFGSTNQTTYFRICEAWNADGTSMSISEYDRRTIRSIDSLYVQKNGSYRLIMTAYSSSTSNVCLNGNSSFCSNDTLILHYKQPRPSINYALTSSYVCSGEAIGHIKLVGVGGYGAGNEYEYEIVGSDPLQKNTTGEFTFGSPNEKLIIKITDKSPLGIVCNASIEQGVTLLDLSEASIAYSVNGGNFCEGETILLNCVSLGNTTFQWEGPNGFSSTDQFPRIPNSTPNMSGFYYISVTPENCGDEMKDSVLITVHPNPPKPEVTKTTLEVCFNSGFYYLTTLSEAQPLVGNSLVWYDSDGVTVLITDRINSAVSLVNNTKNYYVSQKVDATGCESEKVEIDFHILLIPLSPFVPTPPAVCYKDSLIIHIPGDSVDFSYKLYNSSSVFLQEKQGTGSGVSFNPIEYNSTASSITFYVTTVNKGCESNPKASVVVPRAPTAEVTDVLVSAEHDTVCVGESVLLTASSVGITNPVYRWYNSKSSSALLLWEGDTYQPPPLISTTNYSYSVSVSGDGLCENLPSARKLLSIRTLGYATSGYITTANQTKCVGDIVTIVVTSPSVTNPVYTWYTSQTELIPFHTGDYLITTPILKDTTFYIGVSGTLYCENKPGYRKAVRITVTGFSGIEIENITASTCGANDGSAFIHVKDVSGSLRYKVNGSPSWITVTANPFKLSNLRPGSNRFEINETKGCRNIDTVITIPSTMLAVNDTVYIFERNQIIVPFSNNDCDPGRLTTRDSIIETGKKGTAVLTEPRNGSLKYTHTGGVGIDSVLYRMKTTYDSTDAKIQIYILATPEIVLLDSCGFAPYMTLNIEYSLTTFLWEYSEDQVNWINLGVNSATYKGTIPGYYRVIITYNGLSTTTVIRKLVQEKKVIIQNKEWYQMTLE